MVTVELKNLRFNAFHGIHEEEKILGNEYVVSAMVRFQENTDVIVHVNDTVNYAAIYEIINRRMCIPTSLLETVAMETGSEIHQRFPQIQSVSLSITKMHPPIEGMQGSAVVSWSKQF